MSHPSRRGAKPTGRRTGSPRARRRARRSPKNHHRRATRCAYQSEPRPVQDERLAYLENDILRVIGLRDPEGAVEAADRQTFTIVDVEHLAWLEMERSSVQPV